MSANDKQPASNIPSFADALTAAKQMQQDWLEHGVNFVDLYVEDVDGSKKSGVDRPSRGFLRTS